MSIADELGIEEVEPGLFPDTFEVRQAIRRAKKQYRRIYMSRGDDGEQMIPLLHVVDEMAEFKELASRKSAILKDTRDPNSDFISGQDLLDDLDAMEETPPWVIKQTRTQLELVANGEPMKRGLPIRCQFVRSDGRRCFAWSPMKKSAPGLCQTHAKYEGNTWVEYNSLEAARSILLQSAPAMASNLEMLALTADSEPVRLKATSEILDRIGIRGGMDLSVEHNVNEIDPAAEVRQRLEQLADRLAQKDKQEQIAKEKEDIVDAEVVEDES